MFFTINQSIFLCVFYFYQVHVSFYEPYYKYLIRRERVDSHIDITETKTGPITQIQVERHLGAKSKSIFHLVKFQLATGMENSELKFSKPLKLDTNAKLPNDDNYAILLIG